MTDKNDRTMKRLFRVDFYPQEWIADTMRLTNEERGVFIQVVALIYSTRGAIPYDKRWLSSACNCSARSVKSIIDRLISNGWLISLENGAKITQKRAEHELNLKRTLIENGAKGQRKRRENEGESNENKDLSSSHEQNSLSSPKEVAKEVAKEDHLIDHQMIDGEPLPDGTPKDRETVKPEPQKEQNDNAHKKPASNRRLSAPPVPLSAVVEGLDPDRVPPEFAEYPKTAHGWDDKSIALQWRGFVRYWTGADAKSGGKKRDWLRTWENNVDASVDRGFGARRGGAGKNSSPVWDAVDNLRGKETGF